MFKHFILFNCGSSLDSEIFQIVEKHHKCLFHKMHFKYVHLLIYFEKIIKINLNMKSYYIFLNQSSNYFHGKKSFTNVNKQCLLLKLKHLLICF